MMFMPQTSRCPHCGVAVSANLIPASHNSFYCPRCRKELEVFAPDSWPILLASLVLAIVACVVFGLRGLALVAGMAGATIALLCIGLLARELLATPKLKTLSGKSLPLPAKRTHPTR